MLRHIIPLLLLIIADCPATSAFTYRDISEKASPKKAPHKSVTFGPSDDGSPISLPTIFRTKSGGSILRRRYSCLVLQARGSDEGKGGGEKKGYRFGDLTKSLIGGSVEKVSDFTK